MRCAIKIPQLFFIFLKSSSKLKAHYLMLDHFNSKSGIKFKKTSQNKIN